MLILFYKDGCPYCDKVRGFFGEKNVDFNEVDSPGGAPSRSILLKLGGKEQVPFLVDTDKGEMMYESDDIIKYVESNYI